MEYLGNLISFALFAVGGVLSFLVWVLGLLFRKRLRGPARIIVMTVSLIVWYTTLFPLTNSQEYADLALPLTIGIHSIWVWWLVSLWRFWERAKREAGRTNWKTGVSKATGVYHVTKEITKIREQRKTALAKAKTAAAASQMQSQESDFQI